MKKNYQLIKLITLAFCIVAGRSWGEETTTSSSDWCKVTTPKEVSVGKAFPVKVEFTGKVDPSLKLQANLHWANKDGKYSGFLSWGGAPKPIQGKKVLEFKLKPGKKDNIGFTQVHLYLSPDGSFEKKTNNYMGPKIAIAGSGTTTKPAAAKPAAATCKPQTKDYGWCKLTCPTEVDENAKYKVSIELTESFDPKMKLQTNLHWAKPDGNYGGFLSWGGNPKVIGTKKRFDYTYTAKVKHDLGFIQIQAFLTPDSWKNHVKNLMGPKIAVIKASGSAASNRPSSITFRKSWMSVGANKKGSVQTPGEIWTEGDDWIIPVEYFVDKSEDWGGTKLKLFVVGPWVDNPDGKYTKKRSHHNYHGLSATIDAKIGEKAVHEFKFKIPKPMKGRTGKVGDTLLILARFHGADTKGWPWHIRGTGPRFVRKGGFFELETDEPGHLFPYEKPVVIYAKLKKAATGKGAKKLNYRVTDTSGKEVAKGSVPFTADKAGQKVAIPLTIKERGTFLIKANVDGWESLETTFCRIPDLKPVLKGKKTRFGTNHVVGHGHGKYSEEKIAVSRKLGLTTCRAWLGWKTIEPGKGEFRHLDEWEKGIDLGNKYGIETWLLFYAPPAWALDVPAKDFSYAAFPFRDQELSSTITTLAKRFQGKIAGWEWLNEIVPGNMSKDPVADYTRFCKVATAASKAVDPNAYTMLAGGLWPRSFRNAVLANGVGKYIDILPIHYGNGISVKEARGDLDTVGSRKVRIWDNETARGLSTWNMPLQEALAITNQGEWVVKAWTDELMAGCEKICYFGGQGDAAGNWTYLWDDLSPRPVAATLAVFVSKMYKAKPLGSFRAGENGVFHLFEKRDKTPLLVATSTGSPETVGLICGQPSMIQTNQQGNEKKVAGSEKKNINLEKLHCFLEGGDLDVLKAYVVPSVQAGGATETQIPQVSLISGSTGKIFVRLKNVYDRPIAGTLNLALPQGWAKTKSIPFKVAANQTSMAEMNIPAPPAQANGVQPISLVVNYNWKKLPTVKKDIHLSVISPDMIGNRVKNGNFEEGSGGKAADWGGGGGTLVADKGALGLGNQVWRFNDTKGKYASINQGLSFDGGQKFLYTTWAKTKNMPAGSNVYLKMQDGSKKTLYNVHVFNTPATVEHWELVSSVINAPSAVAKIGIAPVVKGSGYAMYDNIRFTPYEGTDFSGDCDPAPGTIKIDGKLDDWSHKNPIPLIGRNQLRDVKKGYKWNPKNLCGVVYMQWDAKNLYLAAEVLDNVHVASKKNAACKEDDSLIVALHPVNRLKGQDSKAFVFYLSSIGPGGSGKHTIFRPADKSAGLKSGSLAKDSSIYDLAIKHSNGKTTYEVRMPLTDLGGIRGSLGTKIGLSLQLNDNDGNGKAASMQWGGGLNPSWHPESFGVLTFTGK